MDVKSFMTFPPGANVIVVNAAFLSFETSKLWALIMYICRIDGRPKD
jgi:hypothetical protein